MREAFLKLIKAIPILIALSLLLFSLTLLKPSITGYTIYEENSYIWDFQNKSDYIYNENLINLTEEGVELIPNITVSYWNESFETTVYIINAIRNEEDVTSNLILVDQEKININKNNPIDIILEEYLNNNDLINFYLEGNQEENLYLCDYNINCNFPGYGSIYYDKTKNWYNLTLINLTTPKDRFRIISNNKPIFINYIESKKMGVIEQNSTSIIYPESAEIETPDLNPENISSFGMFIAEYELNNQQIDYQYSSDSGATWNALNENENLNLSSNKIRIKSILTSDTTSTPILKNLELTYTIQIPEECIEDWNCTSWNECIDNSQNRNCIDLNNCGTEQNKPNLIQECIISCIPNWTCTDWRNCINENQSRNCTDLNSCEIDKIEVQNCTIQEILNETYSNEESSGESSSSSSQESGNDYSSYKKPSEIISENPPSQQEEKETIETPKETCLDGIQNQNETDIDCGGSCSPCIKDLTGQVTYKNLLKNEISYIIFFLLILLIITILKYKKILKKIKAFKLK